jgi:TRAP transporter T-component
MSCILILYLALYGASAVPLGYTQTGDPDALYTLREDPAKAAEAAAIWAARLKQDPKDFEAAWKLARTRYWLGTHGAEAERKTWLEDGIAAGRIASALQPTRPEGFFWTAASMGALAESFGMRQGLKYRGEIRDTLLVVRKLDPAFQKGSADRALGRWYYKVPGLFGGSKEKSEEHLRKSLTYDPNSTASHFFLAETLLAAGRDADGKAELQKVLDTPGDPDWAPEDREFKTKARQRLSTLK